MSDETATLDHHEEPAEETREMRDCIATTEEGLPCLWSGLVDIAPGDVDPDDGSRLDQWVCPNCGWEHDEKVDPSPDPDGAVGGHDDRASGVDW